MTLKVRARRLTRALVVLALAAACTGDEEGDRREEYAGDRPEDAPVADVDVSGTEVTYYQAPDALEDVEAGQILEQEPMALAAGIDGQAWKITYVTTTPRGELVPSTGIMVRPDADPPEGGYPVVTWAHGTTGVGDECAPSKQPAFNMIGLQQLIDAGYALVATDYLGLGTPGQHPYLVGVAAATSVIDIVRAARGPDGIDAGSDVVAWGYSQGGHAVLFVREIIGEYAPELKLRGIAATAPLVDTGGFLARGYDEHSHFPFTAEAIATWEIVYDEVDLSEIVPAELVEKYRLASQACSFALDEVQVPDPSTLFREDPDNVEAWVRIVDDNTVVPADQDIPMYLVHGELDELIDIEPTRTLVSELCEAGEAVVFDDQPALTHGTAILFASEPLLRWLDARLEGEPAPTNCQG
ncbi:MAG: hypothetical protein JJLCMIEE_01765 [Acidimicrobiales bacterium]|nr:MAG: hypothetical protein EDR02_05670 [Actinomycetota bacterium]MBV6508699.1 hypothetical protein [Acidimicrobiales bacterium]RIK08133.1 MAG: hypothetical protein DCC48_01790 [Acidobacteriota bacterium]